MENLFIPYELAIIAKEKGFDDHCLGYFNHKKSFCYMISIGISNSDAKECLSDGSIAGPIYQQILDWFRDKHNIIINVDFDSKEYFYCFTFISTNDRHVLDGLSTYYEALNKALEEAFKLI